VRLFALREVQLNAFRADYYSDSRWVTFFLPAVAGIAGQGGSQFPFHVRVVRDVLPDDVPFAAVFRWRVLSGDFGWRQENYANVRSFPADELRQVLQAGYLELHSG
jgi:hypothetical protein